MLVMIAREFLNAIKIPVELVISEYFEIPKFHNKDTVVDFYE